MGYFPFFVELKDVPGLLVGGGSVALRKAEKLLPFGPALTVAAPEILPRLAALPGVKLLRESFRPELLDGVAFVIAATDDRGRNREIAGLCRARQIPVNAVDDREACTFLFPALVQEGALTVGISTGGASPAAAAWLRSTVQDALPDSFDAILVFLEKARPQVKARIPREKVRAGVLKELLAACLERGGPLEAEELERMLEREADR